MIYQSIKGAVLVVFVFCMAGCFGAKKEFQESVESYNNAIRWKDVPSAMEFVAPELQAPFFKNARRFFKQSQVTDFQVDHVEELSPGGEEGYRVHVIFTYLDGRSNLLKEVFSEQLWKYNETIDRWVVLIDRPVTPSKIQ